MWLLQDLCGWYRVYVVLTGSMRLLQGLCGCYRVYVAVTGYMWLLQDICGCYRVYVVVTGSMWLLQGLCGCYRVNEAVTGSMWLLQGLWGCYRVYVVVTGSMWLLQGLCGCHGVSAHSYMQKSLCVALTGRLYAKVWHGIILQQCMVFYDEDNITLFTYNPIFFWPLEGKKMKSLTIHIFDVHRLAKIN